MKKAILILIVALPVLYLAQQGTTVIKSYTANRQADVDINHNLLVRGGVDTPCYINGGQGTVNATTNFAVCKTLAGTFLGARAINTTGTIAYLRMYNLASAPTCTSAAGFVEAIPVPANTTGAGFIDALSNYAYNTGIAYCVTANGTSTDNTAPVAGVYITISYN